MKILLLIMTLTPMQQLFGAGHSEAQTNALIRSLLQPALIRSNFDPQTETIKGGPRYVLTQMEFFAADEEWSTEEKKGAFDWYLQHLSTTKQSYGVVRGRLMEENPLARAAINQCEVMGYTNAVPVLCEIARGVADPGRIASIELLLKWSAIDGPLVNLVGDIVSNDVWYARDERNAAYRMFCSRLLQSEPGASGDSARQAGEGLMYGRRCDPVGAVAVDNLLVRSRANYAHSVDRCETALAILANTNAMSGCVRYFVSVTNLVRQVSVRSTDN